MERTTILLIMLLLAGCSLAGGVSQGSIEYDRALEDVSNSMVVSNILRARDSAPLHFSDLSQIRGALQFQLQGQTNTPFGPNYVSSSRNRALAQASVTLSTAPTFDVVPLNTKEFTEGITAPISLSTLLYYANRLADYLGHFSDGAGPKDAAKEFMQLFVEKVSVDNCDFSNHPDRTVTGPDDPTRSRRDCNEMVRGAFQLEPSQPINFDTILSQVISRIWVGTYEAHHPFGPPAQVNGSEFLKDADKLATSGLEVRTIHPGWIQLYKKTTETAVCMASPQRTNWLLLGLGKLDQPISLEAPNLPAYEICTSGEVWLDRLPKDANPRPPRVVLYPRSVESVIYYLGAMLTVPEQKRALPFFIGDTQPQRERFSVSYRGTTYYVAESNGSHDETLLILSIVNQILNLYKKASEIPTTAAVQSVP